MLVDDTVTVLTYKSKTVLSVLTDIAGLLVIACLLTFLLHSFNECMFNRNFKRETNDEFREVFTYMNFKKAMVEIMEIRAENYRMKVQNIELRTEVEGLKQLQQRVAELEKFCGY